MASSDFSWPYVHRAECSIKYLISTLYSSLPRGCRTPSAWYTRRKFHIFRMPFFKIIRRVVRRRRSRSGRVRGSGRRRGHRGRSSRAFLLHKESARALVHARLEYFAEIYRITHRHSALTYGRVSIRDQKTRWGSCSRRGNLNFNYKIVLLPPHLADYLVVHELCHLIQFDHSAAFWSLVALAVPEYVGCREELRRVRVVRGCSNKNKPAT